MSNQPNKCFWDRTPQPRPRPCYIPVQTDCGSDMEPTPSSHHDSDSSFSISLSGNDAISTNSASIGPPISPWLGLVSPCVNDGLGTQNINQSNEEEITFGTPVISGEESSNSTPNPTPVNISGITRPRESPCPPRNVAPRFPTNPQLRPGATCPDFGFPPPLPKPFLVRRDGPCASGLGTPPPRTLLPDRLLERAGLNIRPHPSQILCPFGTGGEVPNISLLPGGSLKCNVRERPPAPALIPSPLPCPVTDPNPPPPPPCEVIEPCAVELPPSPKIEIICEGTIQGVSVNGAFWPLNSDTGRPPEPIAQLMGLKTGERVCPPRACPVQQQQQQAVINELQTHLKPISCLLDGTIPNTVWPNQQDDISTIPTPSCVAQNGSCTSTPTGVPFTVTSPQPPSILQCPNPPTPSVVSGELSIPPPPTPTNPISVSGTQSVEPISTCSDLETVEPISTCSDLQTVTSVPSTSSDLQTVTSCSDFETVTSSNPVNLGFELPPVPPTADDSSCLDQCKRFQEHMRRKGCPGTVICRKRPSKSDNPPKQKKQKGCTATATCNCS